MKNPCYKCENRRIGCHSTCEQYISWSQEETRRKRQIYNTKAHIEKTYPATIKRSRRHEEV